MKRIVAIILAALTFTAILGGCKQNKTKISRAIAALGPPLEKTDSGG